MIPAGPHTCLSMHWSHDFPVAPTLQGHWPVTWSHGPDKVPHGEHLHSSQRPPGIRGFPWYPVEHLEEKNHRKKEGGHCYCCFDKRFSLCLIKSGGQKVYRIFHLCVLHLSQYFPSYPSGQAVHW